MNATQLYREAAGLNPALTKEELEAEKDQKKFAEEDKGKWAEFSKSPRGIDLKEELEARIRELRRFTKILTTETYETKAMNQMVLGLHEIRILDCVLNFIKSGEYKD